MSLLYFCNISMYCFALYPFRPFPLALPRLVSPGEYLFQFLSKTVVVNNVPLAVVKPSHKELVISIVAKIPHKWFEILGYAKLI